MEEIPDLDQAIQINGEDKALRDIPWPESAMWGIGHFYYKQLGRTVIEKSDGGKWEYTPETCLLADVDGSNTWINDGKVLVCNGCGLDCT